MTEYKNDPYHHNIIRYKVIWDSKTKENTFDQEL